MAKKKPTKKVVKNTQRKSPPAPALRAVEPTAVSPLQQHFISSGVRFGLTTDQVLTLVRDLLGKNRYKQWIAASRARQEGRGNPAVEYEKLHTAEEINTLFSLQSRVSLGVCQWLSDRVGEQARKYRRIDDLGCGSGVLTGWLASRHPECQVIGWDSLRNIVTAAASSQKHSNLTFGLWDYATANCPEPGSCDVMVTCFGIDFPITQGHYSHQTDPAPVRKSQYYARMLSWLRPYFRGWRTAIRDEGLLHAVLRISSEELFLATVDAARDEGWQLDADLYEYIACGGEHFPAMTFRAVATSPCSEEEVISLWCRHVFRDCFATELVDSAATRAYMSLADRTILKTDSRDYDDGHFMDAVVGRAGYLGFQYTHATTGFARLKLMSIDDASRSEPWFPEPKPLWS
jgi:SAM-dependent methyltransferase